MKKRHHYLPTALAMVSVALCLFGCPIAPIAEPALSADADLAAFVAVWEGVGPLFAFDPATASYSVDVPNSLLSITVVLSTEHLAATMALNGVTINSGDPRAIPLGVGSNIITLTIVAEDGVTEKSYSLEVNRAASDPSNANLAWMTVSEGGLDPDFAAQTVSYDVTVDASVSNMTIMPFVSDLAAAVKVNGSDVAHATESDPISLGIGSTAVSVLVTAGDGSTTKTYTITVTRPGLSNNASLSELVPIPGSLNPGFSPSVISYSVSLSNSQASIRFTPTAEESHATIAVDGEQVVSGNTSAPILLEVGPNVVSVVVTAQDGSTTKTYTITVTRAAPSSNANLSDLVPIPGSLSPAFSPSTLGYAVSVDSSAESIRFSPAAEDSHASITVNGQQVVSGGTSEPIVLVVGSNEVNVVVTAEDGTTTKTYTITVTRAAPSSNANL